MAIQTPEEYYGDEELHGGYQFVTLETIVNKLMAFSMDPDHYLASTRRRLIRLHAKQGIKSLARSVKKIIKATEETVGPDLYCILPQDFIDYVRVSYVDDNRRLVTLDVNDDINTAIGYLQDHVENVLFDFDGQILEADSHNAYNHPYIIHKFNQDPGGQPFLNTSKLTNSGEFKIDPERGRIVFSSNMDDREVVIEYVSDGLGNEDLHDTEIRIHKDLEEVLLKYVYSECISGRRNVPYSEKTRASKEYKTLVHKAKISALALDFNQIIRISRTSTIQG